MIPIIGIMIGAYIFVCGFDMFFQERVGAEQKLVRGLRVTVILVDYLCVMGLIGTSWSIPSIPGEGRVLDLLFELIKPVLKMTPTPSPTPLAAAHSGGISIIGIGAVSNQRPEA